MREIKFRAWYKPKGKMYTQSLESINFETKVLGVYTVKDGYQQLRMSDFELMQYTGLKDCNGKEIYEGDIVKLGTNERFYVAWHDYKQEFTFRGYGGGYYPNTYRGATRDDEYGWEVIGNIYKNKEMLMS